MGLDKNVISEFRRKVNESNYVYNTYNNIDDKNKWNCICSAMDWIDIAVDFINSDWNNSKEINIKCMNLFTYISSINVMWEAIEQLHRVFFNTNCTPFKGSENIFTFKINNQDDNKYFKTIRACFGAHPVNLVEPSDPNNNRIKRFASWPYESNFYTTKYDFTVRLYSNQLDADDTHLGIKIDELNAFAIERYNYINEIANEIDRQYKSFENKCISKQIGRSDNIIEQLMILKVEAKNRQAEDYWYVVDDLLLVYNVNPINKNNRKILDKYKEKLVEVVEELYSRLQSMDIRELETDKIINPECPNVLHYAYEKLNSAMHGYHELYAFDTIAEHLKDVIDFNEVKTLEEVYALTLAGFTMVTIKE